MERQPLQTVQSVLALPLPLSTIPPNSVARTNFEANFKADLATTVSASSGFLVTAERVVINSISAGSVIVDFSIVPDSNGVPLQSSSLAAAFSAPVSMGVLGVTTSSIITPAVVTTKQAPVATLSAPGLLPAAGLLADPAAPTKPASPSASSTASPPVPIAGYSADKPGSQLRAAGNDKQDTLEGVLICSLVGGLVLAIVVVVAIRRASRKAKVEFEMARVKAEVARVYDEAYSGAKGAAVVGINRLETTLGVDLDGDGDIGVVNAAEDQPKQPGPEPAPGETGSSLPRLPSRGATTDGPRP